MLGFCSIEKSKKKPGFQGIGPFTNLKNKNTKMPPQDKSSCVDVFVDLVLADLKLPWYRSIDNCTKDEHEVLNKFGKGPIHYYKALRQGGVGRNTVVMDHVKYGLLCEDLLRDNDCYETLGIDPTDDFKSELKHLLIGAKTQKTAFMTKN